MAGKDLKKGDHSDSDSDGMPEQRGFHMKDFDKTGPARRELVAAFVEQLKYYGYALITFLDEDEEVIRNVHDSSMEFFGLPQEEKYKIGEMRQENGQLVGYGVSANREQMELRLTPDNKPYPNPGTPATFESAAVAAYRLFVKHGTKMLTAIEEARKMTPGSITNLLDPEQIPEKTMTNPVFRICNYSQAHSKRMFDRDNKVDVVCEDHTDIGLITLDPCSPNPGLQVRRTYDGQWDFVEKVGNKITEVSVMVGDTMEQLTNGYLMATRHRVVRPVSGQRVGMPFLHRARPDAILPNMTASVRMVPGIKSARSILKNWRINSNETKKQLSEDAAGGANANANANATPNANAPSGSGSGAVDPRAAVAGKAAQGSALFTAVAQKL